MRTLIIQLCTLLSVLLIGACADDQSVPDEPEVPETESAMLRGKVHCAGQGIAGVVVTDGFTFAVTDGSGNYSLPSGCRTMSISSPAGYTIR